MIVVDTTAVVAALAVHPVDQALVARLSGDGDLHAPHLIDVEVLHVLRRLVRTGNLSEQRARQVRANFADLAIVRYPHAPLADRVWDLRSNVSAYDAVFVALSEALDVPLVTCDRRLASTTHAATVEVYAGR